MDMGQVTQTTNHIGLGNPMWERESNPGPREGVNSRVVLARARKSRPGWPGLVVLAGLLADLLAFVLAGVPAHEARACV